MRRNVPRTFVIVMLLVAASTPAAHSVTFAEEVPIQPTAVETGDNVAAVFQSADDALAADLALVAEAKGWTSDETASYHESEQEIGRIAEIVAVERPEIFVGTALSLDPMGPPVLYIKGPADESLAELVATAAVPVKIADDQPLALDELEARKRDVHEALQSMGFEHVVTGTNIEGAGVITAAVSGGDPTITVSAAQANLPAELRDFVDLSIRIEDVAEPEGHLAECALTTAGCRGARAAGRSRRRTRLFVASPRRDTARRATRSTILDMVCIQQHGRQHIWDSGVMSAGSRLGRPRRMTSTRMPPPSEMSRLWSRRPVSLSTNPSAATAGQRTTETARSPFVCVDRL